MSIKANDDSKEVSVKENDKRHKKISNFEQIIRPKAFLPLSILTYYNFLYSIFYLIAVSLLFIYKGFVLPYPPRSIGPEAVGFLFFMIIQYIRISILNRGHKTETKFFLFLSLFLSIPVLMGIVFLIRFQTYVFVFDLGLNIFMFIFTCCEMLLTIVTLIKLS